jgi:hypothetical protein
MLREFLACNGNEIVARTKAKVAGLPVSIATATELTEGLNHLIERSLAAKDRRRACRTSSCRHRSAETVAALVNTRADCRSRSSRRAQSSVRIRNSLPMDHE